DVAPPTQPDGAPALPHFQITSSLALTPGVSPTCSVLIFALALLPYVTSMPPLLTTILDTYLPWIVPEEPMPADKLVPGQAPRFARNSATAVFAADAIARPSEACVRTR